jgi:hypothetical protein
MGAVAAVSWLAIGSALVFTGILVVAALCCMALRLGVEVKGEIKAPLLRLSFHARASDRGIRSADDPER